MSRPAVFLDRDGTLIVEKVYLSDPEGIVIVPGTFEALRLLRERGYALVTVTNQSGIARGYYTEDDYHRVAGRLDELLGEAGTPVDLTLFCPHHPEHGGPCGCRKPATGMHRRAAEALDLDLAASYYVGDKLSDVLPALELGGQGILVRTGYGAEHEPDAPPEVRVADDLRAAVALMRPGADGVAPVFRGGLP